MLMDVPVLPARPVRPEVVDIEAAGSHVGGYEELHALGAKLLHGEVPLRLGELAVESLGVVSVLYEFVGHLLCLHACAAEDDGVDAGAVVDDALEGGVFVAGVHEVVFVINLLGALIARAHDDLLGVREVGAGHALYVLTHGGGEEQCVAVRRHTGEDLVDALGESHVEHLIGLVEHHILYALELGRTPLHEVDEASRGGHDDLYAALEGPDLRTDIGAAVDGENSDVGHVAGEVLQVASYLEAELPRRAEHNGLHTVLLRVDLLQQGKAVGRSLARTRLCESYYIIAVTQEIGNHGFLYRHRTFVAQFSYSFYQLGA